MRPDDARNQTTAEGDLSDVRLLWRDLEVYLDEERRRIQAEISAYPMPIPACDAQFNALLDERDRLVEHLRQVRARREQGGADAAALERIRQFLAESTCVPSEIKDRIRASLAFAARIEGSTNTPR